MALTVRGRAFVGVESIESTTCARRMVGPAAIKIASAVDLLTTMKSEEVGDGWRGAIVSGARTDEIGST
jgi:hypothetical protein